MIQRRSLISDSRSVKFYASCAAADDVFMLQGFRLISSVILSAFACNDFHSKPSSSWHHKGAILSKGRFFLPSGKSIEEGHSCSFRSIID